MMYLSWVAVKTSFGYIVKIVLSSVATMVKRNKHLSREYAAFLVRLKQARRDAGFSQLTAAKMLGKPRSFISKCEMGERRVDIVECRVFANLYRKDMSFFCDY